MSTESPIVATNSPRIFGNDKLSSRISQFQTAADKTKWEQRQNPFSGSFEAQSLRSKISINDPNYGRPVAGSKTEARGIKAHQSIEDEIRVLCSVIEDHGGPVEPPAEGLAQIKFRELFRLYQVISNKVVGVLIRARKHGYLDFEGEMLYQGRDNEKIITLIKSPQRGYQVTKNNIIMIGDKS